MDLEAIFSDNNLVRPPIENEKSPTAKVSIEQKLATVDVDQRKKKYVQHDPVSTKKKVIFF